MILNAPKVVINEDYINRKKLSSKNPEEFQRWVQIRQAMIQSQIQLRKSRGVIPDPKLESLLKIFDGINSDKKEEESDKSN
jgi:hypothetical protein